MSLSKELNSNKLTSAKKKALGKEVNKLKAAVSTERFRKNMDPVKSGEWLNPYNPKAPKKLAALRAKDMLKKGKVQNQVSLDTLRKLPTEDLLLVMNKEKLRDTFINKDGSVDFKLPKLEKAVGLGNLFGEETPLLLIGDKNENKRYAERRSGGHYYYVGTNRRALIYTGDMVVTPDSKAELAKWKKDAENDRRENRKSISKRRKEFEKKMRTRGGKGALAAYKQRNNPIIKRLISKMIKDKRAPLQVSPKTISFWRHVHGRLTNPEGGQYSETYAKDFKEELNPKNAVAKKEVNYEFPPDTVRHSEKFLKARKERIKAIKDYLSSMNIRNKKLLPLPKDLLANQIYKQNKKLGPLKREDVEFIKATAKEYDRLIRSSKKGMTNGEAIELALGNITKETKKAEPPIRIAQSNVRPSWMKSSGH